MAKAAVFVFGYPPATRGGGPIVSVSRLCEAESDYDVRVLTRDREYLRPNPSFGFPRRTWVPRGRANVAYLRTGIADWAWAVNSLRRWRPDVYYVNSLHGWLFSVVPVALVRFGVLPKGLILISPRGECSRGSLSIRPKKKRLARRLLNRLHGKDSVWHASSPVEADDIRRWLHSDGQRAEVLVYPNWPPRPKQASDPQAGGRGLRVVFAARIHRTKGLLEAIDLLGQASCQVRLSVYGPIEDPDYWLECRARAASLGPSITVTYRGEFSHDEAEGLYSASDVFILLSKGESFSQSIAEALSFGCPVIISDATPWTQFVNDGVGSASDDPQAHLAFIDTYMSLSVVERSNFRSRVRSAYDEWFTRNVPRGSLFSRAQDVSLRPRETLTNLGYGATEESASRPRTESASR